MPTRVGEAAGCVHGPVHCARREAAVPRGPKAAEGGGHAGVVPGPSLAPAGARTGRVGATSGDRAQAVRGARAG